ncbi:hypothetical protein PFISCL1PPCAC_2963, partial [Pristionchus fissidentatus]
SQNMSGALKKIIDAKTLQSLVASGAINKEGIRLFDCTYFPTPFVQAPTLVRTLSLLSTGGEPSKEVAEWQRFKEENYGRFSKMIAAESRAHSIYAASHIPGAVHCDPAIATYPSRYERFTYYPADIFEQYIQLLGVNKGEHIIVYGRGAQGGMLFAGKMAWILKSYGQEKLSLLDGGIENWKKSKFELSKQAVQPQRGDWTAIDRIADCNISLEQLQQKDADGKEFIEKSSETRFIDARVRGQFDGTEDTGLDPYSVPASHIPGFTSMPSSELVNENGLLKSEEEIKKVIPAGDKPIVTICNLGVQASLLSYVLDTVDEKTRPKVYPGSLKEMEKRDPKRISAGRRDLPH